MTEANRCAGAFLAITRSLNHMCGIWGIFCVERKLHFLATAVADDRLEDAAYSRSVRTEILPLAVAHEETDRRRFNCECYLSPPVLLLYDV